jgi:hypothetical protein
MHEEEATRFAVSHKVYIAQGVRCDSQKKLKDIVNHLHGAPHAAAMKGKRWSNNGTARTPIILC